MEITLKTGMYGSWTLKDNILIKKNKEYNLATLKRVDWIKPKGFGTYGVITLYFDGDSTNVAYTGKDSEEGENAYHYLDKIAIDNTAKEIIEKSKEIRQKCTVCSHVFCYNQYDLEENEKKAWRAVGSGVTGVFTALSGRLAASNIASMNAQNQLDKIVDYTRCPKCGSRELELISDEEYKKLLEQQNKPQTQTVTAALSPAEELKKFKELLDMGIITQEEFNAKKKELLGL